MLVLPKEVGNTLKGLPPKSLAAVERAIRRSLDKNEELGYTLIREQFVPGDKVSCVTRKGEKKVGILKKMNTRYAHVYVEGEDKIYHIEPKNMEPAVKRTSRKAAPKKAKSTEIN